MLEGITWRQFLVWSLFAMAIYYLVIFAMYGKRGKAGKDHQPPGKPPSENAKKRIWQVAQPEGIEAGAGQQSGQGTLTDEDEWEEDAGLSQQEELEFESLEMLADELQQIITGTKPDTDKAALLTRLQQEIARYPALNKPAFRAAINNLVIRQAKLDCNILISEAEAEVLWAHF